MALVSLKSHAKTLIAIAEIAVVTPAAMPTVKPQLSPDDSRFNRETFADHGPVGLSRATREGSQR